MPCPPSEQEPKALPNSTEECVRRWQGQTLEMLKAILHEQTSLRNEVKQIREALSDRLDGVHAKAKRAASYEFDTHMGGHDVEDAYGIGCASCESEDGSMAFQARATARATRQERRATARETRAASIVHHAIQRTRLEQLLQSTYFEPAIACVILVNVGCMFANLQLRGLREGWKLGLRNSDDAREDYDMLLRAAEYCFNVIYLVELLMRLCAYGIKFLYSAHNFADAFIVLSSCFDVFVFQSMGMQMVNLGTLRVFRVYRFVKIAGHSRSAAPMRVLLRTLLIGIRSMYWSAVLLAAILVAGGIVMSQATHMYLGSDSLGTDRKVWLYKMFGTTFAAMYTMLECTFTGRWGIYARPLIEEVDYLFGAFWVLWVIVVNFSTIRVIGALFLKNTMAVAALESETLAMRQLKRAQVLVAKLQKIFDEADTSGDGFISQEEFDIITQDSKVVSMFEDMGCTMDQVTAFFAVCAADHGLADRHEFIQGALFMATSSPVLDRFKNMRGQISLAEKVNRILEHVQIEDIAANQSGASISTVKTPIVATGSLGWGI